MAILRSGFAEIKNRFNPADYLRRIDPQAILDHYGARNQTEQRNGKDGSTEIVHSCLIDQVERHHANGDENPSAAMNLDKATYACYGYWMGGIFDFVLKMERKEELHDIVGLLAGFVGDSAGGTDDQPADRERFIAELRALLRGDSGPRPPMRSEYDDRTIAGWVGVRHPYATEERRLSERAYERLRLGFDPASGRLVFPHYVGGKLLGWQQRAIPDRPGLWAGSVESEPKYRSNSSFPKSTTLYNVDGRRPGTPTVIVESPMSVAWAVGQGLDNACATFGASIPDAQIEVMRELGPVVLWFDGDAAGYKAEQRVCEKLMRTNDVRVVVPEPGKDLADCSDIEEVRDKIARAKPAVLRRMDYVRGIR